CWSTPPSFSSKVAVAMRKRAPPVPAGLRTRFSIAWTTGVAAASAAGFGGGAAARFFASIGPTTNRPTAPPPRRPPPPRVRIIFLLLVAGAGTSVPSAAGACSVAWVAMICLEAILERGEGACFEAGRRGERPGERQASYHGTGCRSRSGAIV